MWLCGSFGGGAYTPKDLCAHRSGVSTLVRRFQCWDPPNREMFATTTTIRCTNEGRKVCNLITSPRWFSEEKLPENLCRANAGLYSTPPHTGSGAPPCAPPACQAPSVFLAGTGGVCGLTEREVTPRSRSSLPCR
jgi:hypothetical protein